VCVCVCVCVCSRNCSGGNDVCVQENVQVAMLCVCAYMHAFARVFEKMFRWQWWLKQGTVLI
jgi:hypothetical protein